MATEKAETKKPEAKKPEEQSGQAEQPQAAQPQQQVQLDDSNVNSCYTNFWGRWLVIEFYPKGLKQFDCPFLSQNAICYVILVEGI